MNDWVKTIIEEANKQGYSPSDLAMYSGASDTVINLLISGKTKRPNMKTVIRLAEAVGLAVAAKRAGEDNYTPDINIAMRAALWASDKPKAQIMLEAGVVKEVVNSIESGDDIRFSVDTWERLAKVLGVELALVRKMDM